MEHFRVISNEENERNKRLFQNTVEQFKQDLVFLDGCLTIVEIEHQKTRYVTSESLKFIREHLFEMRSMLNDFNMRLENAQDI
jgi:hypothetical protein